MEKISTISRLPGTKSKISNETEGSEKKHKNKGLSFRRNIQMNIDIEKCDNSLDNSNVSEVSIYSCVYFDTQKE